MSICRQPVEGLSRDCCAYLAALNGTLSQDLLNNFVFVGCAELVLESRVGSTVQLALSTVPSIMLSAYRPGQCCGIGD